MRLFQVWKECAPKCLSVFSVIKNKSRYTKSNLKNALPMLWQKNRVIHSTSKNGPWRVLFFGTDEFALESLQRLHTELNKSVRRLEVVTAYKGQENVVMKYAKQHEIPLHAWPITDNIEEFDIGLVVSFGYLIPSHMIQSFPLGMLNVHASLLPRWRGAAPIIYTILSGDSQAGVSIMKIMPKRFDIGDIVFQREINVQPDETMPQLYNKLARIGADLLVKTVEGLPETLFSSKPQTETGVTYAPKVTSKLSLVKWDEMTAKNVYDLQRALHGLYQLTTRFQDMTIKILGIEPLSQPPQGINASQRKPGLTIFDKKNNALVVQCREGSWVSIKKVVVPTRPPMSARDFNNGFILKYKKNNCFFH